MRAVPRASLSRFPQNATSRCTVRAALVHRSLSLCLLVTLVSLATGASFAGGGVSAKIVTVPIASRTMTVAVGYQRLRARGLRVAIARDFSIPPLCLPVATQQSPPAGARVRAGSVVTLSGAFCGAGRAPSSPRSAAVVPLFVGRSLAAVYAWATKRHMFWTVPNLPSLPARQATHFLDNYIVVRQRPKARLVLHRATVDPYSTTLTPLTIWATPRNR